MTTSTPTVSIGMPVRNGLPYLTEALDSLLAQTHDDFELIVSDNASDDGTTEICAEYARHDSRIRFTRNKENLGGAANFNRVFNEARGRYFKWAAADDVCLPRFLERCIETLEMDANVVLCYPQAVRIDERGTRIKDFEDNMHVDHPSASWRFGYVVRNYILANPIFGLIRTDAIRSTNLHGAYPTSDAVLAAELAMQGRFHELPERLFLRRIHKGQSGAMYRTLREVALWFHPHEARGHIFPRWRLLGEHIRAVHQAPLPLHTRVACYFQLVHLARRHRKSYPEEIGYGCRILAERIKSWSTSGDESRARCDRSSKRCRDGD